MKPERNRVRSNRSPISVLPGAWKHNGAQIQLQHAVWAAAICAKFSPKKPPGTRLGNLIYLRLAQARLLLLRERQIFQKLLLPAHTISLSQTLLNTIIMAAQLPNQNSRSALALETSRLFAGRNGAWESDLPVLGPYRTGTGPSHGENRRLPLQLRTGAGHFTPVVQLLGRTSLLRATEPQEQPLEQQRSFSHLVTRIVRQLQRVETSTMAQQSARELRHLTIPHDDAALMPSTQRRRHSEMEELSPAKEQAPAPPVINMAQITESVLQQLDRRLVAARERMGRI